MNESTAKRLNQLLEHKRRMHLAMLAESRALVERDNARRLAEYEAYRLACEQGVAVPPAE